MPTPRVNPSTDLCVSPFQLSDRASQLYTTYHPSQNVHPPLLHLRHLPTRRQERNLHLLRSQDVRPRLR